MNHDDDPQNDGRIYLDWPCDPKVGYGRPPKATQFKPGQSGNPNGRPKGAKTRRFGSGGYTLRDALLAETERTIVIQEGDHKVTLTHLQVILRRLSHEAMKGDPKAAELILRHAAQIERDDRRQDDRLLEYALFYKGKAEAEVERRKALGITDMSDILPHPDQIHIDMTTGEVLISGPMTAREAAAIEEGHKVLHARRQALAELNKFELQQLPPERVKAIAALRRDLEGSIRELCEALGEPYP